MPVRMKVPQVAHLDPNDENYEKRRMMGLCCYNFLGLTATAPSFVPFAGKFVVPF